jgi:hypothetical protein
VPRRAWVAKTLKPFQFPDEKHAWRVRISHELKMLHVKVTGTSTTSQTSRASRANGSPECLLANFDNEANYLRTLLNPEGTASA